MIAPTLATARRDSTGHEIGPDHRNNVLRGFVVAEAMQFKTGRGRFSTDSLRAIVRLMREHPTGTPSHFRHPAPGNDTLGRFLGRARLPRIDGELVRADLFFDATALDVPIGGGKPLAAYIMDLADSDPGAFGASLTLAADKLTERDHRGRALLDAAGRPLPPLWMPSEINSVDFVGRGDATRSLLAFPVSDDLLRARWANKKRKLRTAAEDDDLDMELALARNRNRKRHVAAETEHLDGFDPSQPRDSDGRWVNSVSSGQGVRHADWVKIDKIFDADHGRTGIVNMVKRRRGQSPLYVIALTPRRNQHGAFYFQREFAAEHLLVRKRLAPAPKPVPVPKPPARSGSNKFWPGVAIGTAIGAAMFSADEAELDDLRVRWRNKKRKAGVS